MKVWSHVDERCAGFFALGIAQQTGHPRGRPDHVRDGRREPPSRRRRGVRGARAADRRHGRPAARAARTRRRPDDRPAQALRVERAVVLRDRRAAGRRHRPLPRPRRRRPGGRRVDGRAARAPCTSTSRSRSRSPRTRSTGDIPAEDPLAREGRPGRRPLTSVAARRRDARRGAGLAARPDDRRAAPRRRARRASARFGGRRGRDRVRRRVRLPGAGRSRPPSCGRASTT